MDRANGAVDDEMRDVDAGPRLARGICAGRAARTCPSRRAPNAQKPLTLALAPVNRIAPLPVRDHAPGGLFA